MKYYVRFNSKGEIVGLGKNIPGKEISEAQFLLYDAELQETYELVRQIKQGLITEEELPLEKKDYILSKIKGE